MNRIVILLTLVMFCLVLIIIFSPLLPVHPSDYLYVLFLDYIIFYMFTILLLYKQKDKRILGGFIGLFALFIFIGAMLYLVTVPKQTTDKMGKSCVKECVSFLRTRVYYYEYINIFFYDKTPFLIEDYGKGSFDPFDSELEFVYKYKIGNTYFYEIIEKK